MAFKEINEKHADHLISSNSTKFCQFNAEDNVYYHEDLLKNN